MKEYDYVEVTVEKEKYVKEGIHKGRRGTILDPRCINGQWLVFFADPITSKDIGVAIKEEDLIVVEAYRERQAGDRIILLTEEYQNLGLRKGVHGILCLKLDNDKWLVRFDKQDELTEAVELTLDGNDFIRDTTL